MQEDNTIDRVRMKTRGYLVAVAITERRRRKGVGIALAAAGGTDVLALLHGLPWPLFWAYLSVAITLAGYLLYLSQMYPEAGKPAVKPEPLSWVLFGFLTGAGWIVQVAQGGAEGSWCLGVTALACFIISGWSYLKFEWAFDRVHTRVAVAALVLFAISVLTRDDPTYATLSAVLATAADLTSYIPTFRKSRFHPEEESATNFAFNSIKCIPALLALSAYSVATMVYLVMLTFVNGGFALYLLYRKSQLARLAKPETDE